MMFADVADKQICQFVGLYADETIELGWRQSYRILLYGAERIQGGVVSRQFNGVAVLRNNSDAGDTPGSPTWRLMKYRLAQADDSTDGVTVAQRKLFEQLLGAKSLLEFVDVLNQPVEQAALRT